jgi:hypothetical protein
MPIEMSNAHPAMQMTGTADTPEFYPETPLPVMSKIAPLFP